MSEWRFSVDEQRYDVRRNHTANLVGWYVSPNQKECVFHLIGDKQDEIEISDISRFARPDVEEVLGEDFGDYLPGFNVEIQEAAELAEKYKVLQLVLTGDEKPKCIWTGRSEELLELFREKLIETWMERAEIIYETMLEVQGWAFSYEGDLQVSAVNEKGDPVSCELKMGRRPDVVGLKKLGAEYAQKQLGFRLSADIKTLHEKKIYIIFQGETSRKNIEVDIEKLLKEKKEQQRELRKKKGNMLMRMLGKGNIPEGYDGWRLVHAASKAELKQQRRTHFKKEPLISIAIPIYNTPVPFLKELLDSVKNQTYKNWQLCLADAGEDQTAGDFIRKKYGRDSRIVYRKLSQNEGISVNTNEAIAMADGEYLMLCDHDDVIEPDALYEIVRAINENDKADVIYTDEDKISMDGKHYFDPNFKPDFNLFRLRDNNYICHIFTVRMELLKKVGMLRREFDGAQDFDFILRCVEQAENVIHIPRALYHWRCHMNSTAADPSSKLYAYEAGRKAVEEHYHRQNMDAEVKMSESYGWYKSFVKIQGNPLVSIIIPNKDHTDDLELCLSSIEKMSSYEHYEILVVENNSTQKETFSYYEEMQKKYSRVKLLQWEREFNYSAINNYAAKQAKGEYLLFLNNDTEVISAHWIEEMLMICQQKNVGAVGAKLYYPDDTIQHAGVVIGLGGIAGHIMCGANREETGYCGRLISTQEVSAVTAACMMVTAEAFGSVKGFDEEFAVAFNDIDLCMKLRADHKKIVFTPYAQLYHYESKSRGMENTPEKHLRFRSEIERFEKKWKDFLSKGDPYYSPNLSQKEGDCSLREIEDLK